MVKMRVITTGGGGGAGAGVGASDVACAGADTSAIEVKEFVGLIILNSGVICWSWCWCRCKCN